MMKECELSLKQLQCDLDEAIVYNTAEKNKLRCILTNKEAAAWLENQKLIKIQQQNTFHDRIVEDMNADYQVRKSELEGLLKAAQEKLAQVDQVMEVVHKELADTCARKAEWKIMAEKVTKEFCKLRVTSGSELSCARSMLMEKDIEGVQLTEQLFNTSSQLKGVVIENCQLRADVKDTIKQSENMMAEVMRLKQRKFHDRISLDVQKSKFDDLTALHEDINIIKQHKLTVVNNEMDALKQACENRKQAIRDSKQKLEDNCL